MYILSNYIRKYIILPAQIYCNCTACLLKNYEQGNYEITIINKNYISFKSTYSYKVYQCTGHVYKIIL